MFEILGSILLSSSDTFLLVMVLLRLPHASQYFVDRQKILTCRLVCGEFRQVCDKIGACGLVCGGPRQFFGARAYLNQWGIAMRGTWVSVFCKTWPRFSPSRRHLDLDDSVPSLNAVSQDKKSTSVRLTRQIWARQKICSSVTKNRLVCGGLEALQFEHKEAISSCLKLLRWPNTVSARSAVLCKSQRGF